MVRTVRARRRLFSFGLLILLLMMTGMAIAIRWWTMPVKVTVVSALWLKSPTYILRDLANPSPAWSGDLLQEWKDTHLSMMTGRRVLKKAVTKIGKNSAPMLFAQADPVEYLNDRIRAVPIAGTELVEIELPCTEDTAKQCQLIVNTVVSTYLDIVKDYDREDDHQLLKLLDALKDQERDQLFELEAKIAKVENELLSPNDMEPQGLELELGDLKLQLKVRRKLYEQLLERIAYLRLNRNAPSRIAQYSMATVRRDK